MIKVINLYKIFKAGLKEIRAVDGLNFEINRGEFVTITGRSGSGKSTLMYQLGLLDTPTSGTIQINGHDVTELDSRQKNKYRLNNLGYVFQDYALIPTLTATENVLMPIIMGGTKMKEATEIAVEALVEVGLSERIGNLPSQLSGGEQQRVSIARAIANKPEILFADEPTANLDSETAKKVLDVLIDLNNKGLTIVMVTHEPEFAKLGNRTLVMSDGKLIS